MENGEVNNKHKDKYGKLKDILSIWSIKRNRFPYGRLIKHKYILCSHVGIRQWGVDYWETYYPGVNYISVKSLLDIEIIHELTSSWIFWQFGLSSAIYPKMKYELYTN